MPPVSLTVTILVHNFYFIWFQEVWVLKCSSLTFKGKNCDMCYILNDGTFFLEFRITFFKSLTTEHFEDCSLTSFHLSLPLHPLPPSLFTSISSIPETLLSSPVGQLVSCLLRMLPEYLLTNCFHRVILHEKPLHSVLQDLLQSVAWFPEPSTAHSLTMTASAIK